MHSVSGNSLNISFYSHVVGLLDYVKIISIFVLPVMRTALVFVLIFPIEKYVVATIFVFLPLLHLNIQANMTWQT